MPVANGEIQALIKIMDGQYQQIRQIEADQDLLGREGDFRARIEYYHDAVRALTSGDGDPASKYDRLAPERIAHDVAILRQIIDKPFLAGRGEQHLSTQAGLSTASAKPSRTPRPDRSLRNALAKHYKDYTVFFVALLAEKIEDNSQIRTDEANMLAEECEAMESTLEKFQRGEIDAEAVMKAADALEHDDLHALMTNFMQQGGGGPEIRQLIRKLKEMMGLLTEEIKTINQAGLNFATSQLAVYEESQDMVKKLAAQGLNVAGKFVANTIEHSQGRGAGRDM